MAPIAEDLVPLSGGMQLFNRRQSKVEVVIIMNQTTTPEKNTGNGVDDNVKNAGFGSSTQSGGSPQRSGSSYGSTQQSSGSGFQQKQQSEPQRHSEGVVARTIEEQTAKLPSDTFLWASIAAMGVSAFFEFTGKKDKSHFVGQWVAPLLLFGVYNKLVKQQGSDRVSS